MKLKSVPVTGVDKPTRWWLIAVFTVGLAARMLWISVPLNVDEGLWVRRGPAFLQAVLLDRPADTYQRHHPGVTNMWLIGGAVASRYLLRDVLPPDDLVRQFSSLPEYLDAAARLPVVRLPLHVEARLALAFVTALCMTGIFALSWLLFGSSVALLAAVLLLFEPFFLAYQRFVTTDANQTNFTWLALLSFLLFLRGVTEKRSGALWWSLLAGVFFGLGLLSKISAALSLPVFGLAALWWAWRLRSKGGTRQLLLGVLVWALAAVGVVVLLWPALRADPPGTAMRLVKDVGHEVDGHIQFFFGRIVDDPGLGFYPVALVYRLTPLLLLGTVLGLVTLGVPALRRYLRDSASLAVIVLNLVVVMIGLSSASSKLDRYIVPLVPGLSLVAASGIAAITAYLVDTRVGNGTRKSALLRVVLSRPEVVLIAVLAIQIATLLPHAPYYVTYFNPLAGGPAQAQKRLMVGNGELMDRAAAWLDEHAQAKNATVATWYLDSMGPYLGGAAVGLGNRSGEEPEIWKRANFAVLYINMLQRNWPARVVEYFSYQRPLYEASAHGVDYVKVYPGPIVRDADLTELSHRVDLDFEGSAKLLGYDLETSEVSAGESATVTLFWQALQPFPAPDFSVHLAVKDDSGHEWGFADGAPVGGMLPVDQWDPGQIVRDVHRVTVPAGTPPGKYVLDVSFRSPALGKALEISDLGAPVGREATLTGLTVTQPGAAVLLIAQRP
jgi:4-amino-4-deoxy-L-arabinose transferase-like glycosyltransferase